MVMAADVDHSFVDTLEAEQRDLEILLRQLPAEAWSKSTPAAGWDVRDQVIHLADTEDIAHDTVVGGPRTLTAEAERRRGEGGVIPYGIMTGRKLSSEAVLEWWIEAAARNRSALRAANLSARVPWGLGMSWRAFVTARLMEHWAHGLDVRDALEVPAEDTGRLQHIGWLGYSALPYAFHVAGVDVPPDRTLRLDLTGPEGESWTYGPISATDIVSGPAGAWCRRAVQRITVEEAGVLRTLGPLAELAVRNARAFL